MASSLVRPRVSVLGVGTMGKLHARVFADLTLEFTLAGVYDSHDEAAREVARARSVTVFSSEDLAIAAADLVIIASPIDAHAGAARKALERGRHVFVEKPLTATADQAFALARAVRPGQHLFVGHSERFNPVVRALREAVRASDIRSIRLRRTSTSSTPSLRPAEHPVLVSLGVHDIDLTAHLTEHTVAVREVHDLGADCADVTLVAGPRTVARLQVDRRARQRERTIEVSTHDSVYYGDLLGKVLTVAPIAGGVPRSLPVATDEPLVAQAHAIAVALAGSAAAVATGLDGARAIAVATSVVSPTSAVLATGTS